MPSVANAKPSSYDDIIRFLNGARGGDRLAEVERTTQDFSLGWNRTEAKPHLSGSVNGKER